MKFVSFDILRLGSTLVQFIPKRKSFSVLLKPIFAHWAVIDPSKILTLMQNSPKKSLILSKKVNLN